MNKDTTNKTTVFETVAMNLRLPYLYFNFSPKTALNICQSFITIYVLKYLNILCFTYTFSMVNCDDGVCKEVTTLILLEAIRMSTQQLPAWPT